MAGALLVLVIAWVFAPASAGPPLYDGIGFPDEPYRYVEQSPNGVQTPPPTAANGTAKRDVDGFGLLSAASTEQGPQVEIDILAGLVAPAACTRVTVTAVPLTPPESAGDTWGNAYKVNISCVPATDGPVQVASTNDESGAAVILLRAPDATQPGPTFTYSADGVNWRRLSTLRAGNDIYEAPLVGAGFYVLLHAPRGGALGSDPTVQVVIGVLAAIILAILAIRLSRGRAARPANAEAQAEASQEGYEGYPDGEHRSGNWTGGAHPGIGSEPADPEPQQELD